MLAGLYQDGATAAEVVLEHVYRLRVGKALDPLNERDFVVITQRLARALVGVSREAEARALRAALAALDVDWRALSAAARERVVGAARAAVGRLGAQVLPRVEQIFEAEAPALVAASRRATARRFGLRIGSSTTVTDRRISSFVRRSEAHFVRDQLGRRSAEASDRARRVVANGLARGLGQDDIATELAATLSSTISRGKPYWTVVAMSFANRARTYTQLAAFGDAGVQRFRFEAVLDQVTSVACRFMHGREFSVERALQRFDDVERADNPEQVAELQPWVRTATAEDGQQMLYFERGGKRQQIARVEESTRGAADRVGRYSSAIDDKELEAAGLVAPPIHARCRSTIGAL